MGEVWRLVRKVGYAFLNPINDNRGWMIYGRQNWLVANLGVEMLSTISQSWSTRSLGNGDATNRQRHSVVPRDRQGQAGATAGTCRRRAAVSVRRFHVAWQQQQTVNDERRAMTSSTAAAVFSHLSASPSAQMNELTICIWTLESATAAASLMMVVVYRATIAANYFRVQDPYVDGWPGCE